MNITATSIEIDRHLNLTNCQQQLTFIVAPPEDWISEYIIILCCDDGNIRLFDVNLNKIISDTKGHKGKFIDYIMM